MNPLALSRDDMKPKIAGRKRLDSVIEAISWPTGTDVDNKRGTVVYESGEYVVRLSKPGKEAAPDYNRCKYKDGSIGNNPNDMRPEIVYKGVLQDNNATFKDIFKVIEAIKNADMVGLEFMGCILGRSAFMADHIEVSDGVWRYSPSVSVLNELCERIPTMYNVPTEVFLHYLNALALNEDTKYHTLGYDITKDTGRRNNLLTCVNLVGVFLDRVSIVDFAGSFSRPPSGISAISMTKMLEIFPDLSEEENSQQSLI